MNRRDFIKALLGVAVAGMAARYEGRAKYEGFTILPVVDPTPSWSTGGCITVDGEVVKLMRWDHDSMSAEWQSYAEKQRLTIAKHNDAKLDNLLHRFEYDA